MSAREWCVLLSYWSWDRIRTIDSSKLLACRRPSCHWQGHGIIGRNERATSSISATHALQDRSCWQVDLVDERA